METPLAECESFVKERFHSGTYGFGAANTMAHEGQTAEADVSEAESCEGDDAGDVDKTCHSQFGGLCEQSPVTVHAARLVQVLARALVDHQLKVGQLLLLSTRADSFLGFLGICMKRPRLHVLLQAHAQPDGDRVDFLQPDCDRPTCLTAHQLFERMLSQEMVGGFLPKDHTLTIEVWKYDLLWEPPRAVIQMDSVLKTISLNSKTPLTVKKPQLRLPFGIKRPGATDKKSQKKRKAGNRKKRGKVEPAKRKSRQRQTESDNASTCSHDDSSSDSGDDDPTRALFEVEEPLPISDSAAQEEEKVVKILDAYGAICSAHESLVESMSSSDPASSSSTAAAASSVPSASVAEKNVCKPSSKTETHKPKTSSYFSKTLGVDEVGIAASARSMCFFCKNRIEKGTVRFSLHHNTKRPPAWVHSMCLPSLLCQEGSLMGPSKQRLEHLKNSGTLDHGLREAVSSALSAMPSG